MKNMLFSIMVLLSIAGTIVLPLHSCKSRKSDMIVKKWSIQNIETNEKIPEEMKEMYENFMKEMLKSATFEFKADGTYEILLMGQASQGIWTLSNDGKQLHLKENRNNAGERGKADDNEQVMTIEELNTDKFVLSAEENGISRRITLVTLAQ